MVNQCEKYFLRINGFEKVNKQSEKGIVIKIKLDGLTMTEFKIARSWKR